MEKGIQTRGIPTGIERVEHSKHSLSLQSQNSPTDTSAKAISESGARASQPMRSLLLQNTHPPYLPRVLPTSTPFPPFSSSFSSVASPFLTPKHSPSVCLSVSFCFSPSRA
ncbi:hypothetical protein ACFX2I_000202 [Malus domestica]